MSPQRPSSKGRTRRTCQSAEAAGRAAAGTPRDVHKREAAPRPGAEPCPGPAARRLRDKLRRGRPGCESGGGEVGRPRLSSGAPRYLPPGRSLASMPPERTRERVFGSGCRTARKPRGGHGTPVPAAARLPQPPLRCQHNRKENAVSPESPTLQANPKTTLLRGRGATQDTTRASWARLAGGRPPRPTEWSDPKPSSLQPTVLARCPGAPQELQSPGRAAGTGDRGAASVLRGEGSARTLPISPKPTSPSAHDLVGHLLTPPLSTEQGACPETEDRGREDACGRGGVGLRSGGAGPLPARADPSSGSSLPGTPPR